MSRQFHLANIALVLIFSCMITNSFSTQRTIPHSVSWLNFNKDSERFTLTNPHNDVVIQFSSPQSQAQAQSIQITSDRFWKANYKVGSHQVDYIAKQKEILLHVGSQIEDKIQILIKGAQNQHQKIYVSSQSMQNSFKPIAQICDIKQQNKISCNITGKQQLYLLYSNTAKKSSLAQFLSQTNNSQKYSNATVKFLRRLNVAQCPLKYASDMLTYTLSSLCVQKSEYEGYEFYGLCANGNDKKIDRYYSLLVVEILFNYNQQLAQWLVENFLDLLQQKLFYSFESKQWIPIPEHIEVFLTYLNHVTQNSSLTSKQIKNRINKVIQIQNGLINNLLLSQVNHLSQQINYRQNNKVHPTILKMLNQAWKTDLPRARVSSIYAESFTSDFFYHEQDQKLDSSVGKMAWLIKLVNQHIKIISKYGDSFQKQSLEQVLSLAKVIQGFFLDDPRAKNGQFQSVIITEKQRMYSQSIGYETLLPFTYKISPIFPQSTVVNLTTTYGLASMPPEHPKSSQKYNFRGNINLYFNYKILFGFFETCQQNPKQYPFINNVKYHIDTFQRKISDYFYHPNRQSKVFYTSWAGKKGHSSQKYLAIINVAFLKDLNSQLSKWATKNSDKEQIKK